MLKLNSLDLLILCAYVLITLFVGFLGGKKSNVETYFANNRATKLPAMLGSTIATWVGAGAIIGVCSASFSTGISYALSVVLINSLGSSRKSVGKKHQETAWEVRFT